MEENRDLKTLMENWQNALNDLEEATKAKEEADREATRASGRHYNAVRRKKEAWKKLQEARTRLSGERPVQITTVPQ